jgi:uncharacterized protein YqeY
MTLLERIEADIKDAMRQKATVKLDALRMLKSELKYFMLEKKLDTLADADVITVVQRQVKKHKDSIESYEKGGRADLVEKERSELAVLSAYLPQQLSESELEDIVKTAIAEVGAVSKADMGKVMKALMPRVAGRADGKLVSQMVQAKLS